MTDPTKTTSWRDLIKVHPAADAFPMMSPEELRVMANDMLANGLDLSSFPLKMHTDETGTRSLLDGRNRLDAMELAGYTFNLYEDILLATRPDGAPEALGVQDEVGTDPKTLVIRANLTRRHLSTEDRKRIAKELLKANPARSDRSISKEVGISPTTVGTIRSEVEPATVQSGQSEQEPAKRVGRDGKARKMPAGRKSAKARTIEKPRATTKDQPAPGVEPTQPVEEPAQKDVLNKIAWHIHQSLALIENTKIQQQAEIGEWFRKARDVCRERGENFDAWCKSGKFDLLSDPKQDQPALIVEPARERATTPALSDDEQFAFRQGHPTVEKSSWDINRAFNRCSHEERQFLCGYILPAILMWFDLEDVAPALFAAEPIEIPPDADLDQLATMFARLTVAQQNDVIDRADSLRDVAQAQPGWS